jgi:hypothetical protein
MFTWICPKCGTEVPPSHSECPNCSSAAAEEQKPAAPQAAAAPVQAAAPAQAAARTPARPSSGMHMPGWVVSILFGVLFVVVLAGGFWLYSSRHKAGDTAPAQAPAPFQAPQPSAAAPDPVLKNLEITGLRLTEDSRHRAFVQFVVVNHSAADLGDVSANVALKAGTGPRSEEPVGTFAFKTTLGPYESRDIKAPLNTKLRVYELPDWQFLRPELSK